MTRWFTLALSLFVGGLLCLDPPAKAWWQSVQQVAVSSGAAGFSGPGDVQSGALAWYSASRCYSAAYANGTNKAVKFRRASDSATMDIVCLTSGFVDSVSAATFCNATSCFINTLYDQSGNSLDCSQATAGLQMPFAFSVVGTIGMANPSRSVGEFCSNGTGITQAQPFVFSYVAKRTGDTSLRSIVVCSGVVQAGFNNSADTVYVYANGSGLPSVSAVDNAFHAVQNVFNNASSDIYVDGGANVSDIGTTNGLSGQFAIGGDTCGSNSATGYIAEVGVWAGAWNSTQKGNMNSNQHSATNGYNF